MYKISYDNISIKTQSRIENLIRMILAVDEQGGIGYKNGLPWPHISDDMQYFKNTTMDQVVVMGIIDNLGKGAAGQAVQNMNLMLGFAENTGLTV